MVCGESKRLLAYGEPDEGVNFKKPRHFPWNLRGSNPWVRLSFGIKNGQTFERMNYIRIHFFLVIFDVIFDVKTR